MKFQFSSEGRVCRESAAARMWRVEETFHPPLPPLPPEQDRMLGGVGGGGVDLTPTKGALCLKIRAGRRSPTGSKQQLPL